MKSSRLQNHHPEKNMLVPDELSVQELIVPVVNYGTRGHASP
jgi:hypothetical protein